MSIDEILKVLQGSLTLVIGIVATYIAWQQWKTNQNKLNLDRYERRLGVYREVIKFISIGIRDAKYDDYELMAFRPKVLEADFLFGEEVSKHLDELQMRAANLSRWNKEYRDDSQPKPQGYNHQEVVDEMHKELIWISSQIKTARSIFKKYLNVGH